MSCMSFVATGSIYRANCHDTSNQLPRYIVSIATHCSQLISSPRVAYAGTLAIDIIVNGATRFTPLGEMLPTKKHKPGT